MLIIFVCSLLGVLQTGQSGGAPQVIWRGDEVFVGPGSGPVAKNVEHLAEPGGELEKELAGVLIRWFENSGPAEFDDNALLEIGAVMGVLEAHIFQKEGLAWAGMYQRYRDFPPTRLDLQGVVRIVDVTKCWDGGSTLIVLEDQRGIRRSVLKAARVTVYVAPNSPLQPTPAGGVH